MIQVTICQLDNYGPWTEAPLRKEADLMALQAQVYAALSQQFSRYDGFLLQGRQDNMLAVTNGMNEEDHRRIQEYVATSFPVTMSMAAAGGETAQEAQMRASRMLQDLGSAQDPCRAMGLSYSSSPELYAQAVHIDMNGFTRETDTRSMYCTYRRVREMETRLAEELSPHGAPVFFIGGDNYLAFANSLGDGLLGEILLKIGGLKAGVGVAKTAGKAVLLSQRALHFIRSSTRPPLLKRYDET